MDLELVISLVLLIGLLSKGFGQDVDNKYRCPDHLSRTYLKAFKDKCYRFEKRTMYWTSARFMCSRENGTLIQIMNQETQNWVVNTLNALQWSTNGVWIGAHDRDIEGGWIWVTGDLITWSYWASGQGNCTRHCLEHCGTLWIDDEGRWYDNPCSAFGYAYSSICQFDMKPATTTTTITTTTPTTTTTTTITNTTPTSALIGLVVACVLGALALLMLVGVFFYKRRKKGDKENSAKSENITYNIATFNQNNGNECSINNLDIIQ